MSNWVCDRFRWLIDVVMFTSLSSWSRRFIDVVISARLMNFLTDLTHCVERYLDTSEFVKFTQLSLWHSHYVYHGIHVWRDWCVYLTWLIHMWRASFNQLVKFSQLSSWRSHLTCLTHAWHDSCICDVTVLLLLLLSLLLFLLSLLSWLWLSWFWSLELSS